MSPSFTQLLHVARSGMLSRLQNLDTISNNLANVNTVGFKRGRENFQEVLNETLAAGAKTVGSGAGEMDNGVRIRASQNLMEQGSLRQTGNSLDLAIDGDGFFAIQLPDGRTGYTRDGQFFLDAERQLVTADGFPLDWDGAIPEDATDIHINPDGSVMARQGDIWNQVGNIQISRFPNPSALQIMDNNLWLANEASGAAQTGAPLSEGFGQILSGALENSTVNLAEEMTSMVATQRGYSLSVQTFQQADQMLYQAIHLRRG